MEFVVCLKQTFNTMSGCSGCSRGFFCTYEDGWIGVTDWRGGLWSLPQTTSQLLLLLCRFGAANIREQRVCLKHTRHSFRRLVLGKSSPLNRTVSENFQHAFVTGAYFINAVENWSVRKSDVTKCNRQSNVYLFISLNIWRTYFDN